MANEDEVPVLRRIKMKDFKMGNIDLLVTEEIINGKEEYLLTKQFSDGSPDESIPIDFHRKCKDENKDSNPWEMWKAKQKQEEEDKNEEALEKPVKMDKKNENK